MRNSQSPLRVYLVTGKFASIRILTAADQRQNHDHADGDTCCGCAVPSQLLCCCGSSAGLRDRIAAVGADQMINGRWQLSQKRESERLNNHEKRISVSFMKTFSERLFSRSNSEGCTQKVSF
jgi:hypothetical protein